MCTVSMIGDHYGEKWPQKLPEAFPMWPTRPHKTFIPNGDLRPPFDVTKISREEFDELKKDVLEMKELLKRAFKYDAEHNQPHCEHPEKVAILKEVSTAVGVDISEFFGDHKK